MNKTCVWCGKKGKKIFHAQVKWKKLNSKWYRCIHCDSLMILPRPHQKIIKQVYEDDYLNQRLQPHIGVDSRIRYAKEYRSTVYKEYELSLNDLKVSPAEVKSVLDFGCADGVFLEFCKTFFPNNTELYGTDISVHMLAQARENGWNVFPLAKLPTLHRKFDLITLWDVAEHLADPDKVIAELKKFLTPKGRILIQTPRFGMLAELHGQHWPHLLPVQHLSVASKEGMSRLAKRLKLAVEVHKSFGANAPSSHVQQPYKQIYDQLAKKLDFGDVQIVKLRRIPHEMPGKAK